MKFPFLNSPDALRKIAEKKAAEALEAEQALREAESIIAQNTALRRNIVEREAQSDALKSIFDKGCKYTIEDFTRDFLNNPTAVSEFAARLFATKNLILDAPEIKREIEKLLVQPHRKSLADFESKHKAILRTLPKPEEKTEPVFVPTKLEPDFYVSGKSAELVKKFQL